MASEHLARRVLRYCSDVVTSPKPRMLSGTCGMVAAGRWIWQTQLCKTSGYCCQRMGPVVSTLHPALSRLISVLKVLLMWPWYLANSTR